MTFHHSTFVHITELQKILRTEIYKEFLGVEKSTGKENCMLFVCNMMHNALIVTSFESSHWNFEKTGHTLRYSNLLYTVHFSNKLYTISISYSLYYSLLYLQCTAWENTSIYMYLHSNWLRCFHSLWWHIQGHTPRMFKS